MLRIRNKNSEVNTLSKDIDTLKKDIADGFYSAQLNMLYGEGRESSDRYLSLLEGFEKCFGKKEIRLFSAPGRTELCGNHTDHQAGCVLAAAIDLDMAAAVAQREDCTVRIVSEGFGELEIDISDTSRRPEEKGKTEALVRGVASAIKERGYTLKGFDVYLKSNVPRGSGLSSSAAFELLVGKIFSALFCSDGLDTTELARIGQYAENEYFGKPCGLMDQMACATGGVVFIDFAEPENPYSEGDDFAFEENGYSLCITNAGGSHAELTDEYAAITDEMYSIAHHFGQDKLAYVSERKFYDSLPELRGRVSDRAILRAMHFFSENNRVKKQLTNLKAGNIEEYLKLMGQSGKSSMGLLQNVWPADKSERSVALALAVSDAALCGNGVSRVHGGGFAGTIQAVVGREMLHSYKKTMDTVFGKGSCQIVNVRAIGAYELK